jgi:DNA-binding beta-propeller fold protein YncE
MAKAISPRKKMMRLAILGLPLTIAAVLLLSGVLTGSGGTGKGPQLISVQPLPDLGAMCELPPEGSRLAAAMAEQRAELQLASLMATPAQQQKLTSAGSATVADKAAVAKRKPLTMIRDNFSAYSALAVDPTHNEIVMVDENQFSILAYDRLANTPPRAALTEPKRIIQGLNAELEFSCSIYVDPVNGDVYAVNNDTLGKTVVFSREQKGNVAPVRSLVTPPFVYGLAIDEKDQEMMFTVQDDAAVTTFPKMAKDRDSALRTLQGVHTGLADPHGITHDTKKDLIYVTNWGTVNVHAEPPAGRPREAGRGLGRANFPVGRNNSVLGSGKSYPPSITVYPRTAKGDTAPLQTIQGDKTQLNWPTSIAVDPERQQLFVANDPTDMITVYDANASGNVAPIRVIKGPKTGLKNPTSVFVDQKNQELWVANYGNHSATVYKLDASGDAAPIRTIRAAPANTPAPMMGNPHTVAYDSKRDQLLVAN